MTETRNIHSNSRSHRLQTEVGNCIAIAVAKPNEFAAILIDEAVRLRARAKEIEDGAMARNATRRCGTHRGITDVRTSGRHRKCDDGGR